jgi:hypothetical protein
MAQDLGRAARSKGTPASQRLRKNRLLRADSLNPVEVLGS